MASSTSAALLMYPSYTENLEVFKNSDDWVKIQNVTSLEASILTWERSSLLNDQVMQWTRARV